MLMADKEPGARQADVDKKSGKQFIKLRRMQLLQAPKHLCSIQPVALCL